MNYLPFHHAFAVHAAYAVQAVFGGLQVAAGEPARFVVGACIFPEVAAPGFLQRCAGPSEAGGATLARWAKVVKDSGAKLN